MNAVSSYLAISPLPGQAQAVSFLWHFPPVTRRSRYEPFYPAEFGLSSLTCGQSDHAPAPYDSVMGKHHKGKEKNLTLFCLDLVVVHDALAGRAVKELIAF